MKMTIEFPPNSIQYSQDFHACRGIPSGVEFTLEERGKNYRLVAPGYGDNNNYGNGAIYVDAQTMRVVLDCLGISG